MVLKVFLLSLLLEISIGKVYDVTTIYRREKGIASLVVHARTNALGLPYYLPNGNIVEPEVGVCFPSLTSWGDWNGWSVQGWKTFIFEKEPAVAPLNPGFIPNEDQNDEIPKSKVKNCEVNHLKHGNISNSGQNMKWCWVINVPKGFFISLNVQYLLRSSREDHLKVFDGDSASAPIIALVDSLAVLNSSGSQMYLEAPHHFSSSFIFNATYLARGTKVLTLSGQQGEIISPIIAPTSEKLCISIHHCMKGAHLDLYLTSFNGTDTVVKQIVLKDDNQWKTSRLVFELGEDLLHKRFQFKLCYTGPETNSVYIERISGCNPEDGEDMLVLYKDVQNGFPEGSIPTPDIPFNDTHCMHGLWDSNSLECSCIPGYTGESCEISCGSNRYGLDCLGVCSPQDDNCKLSSVCKYGLGCTCMSGWTGKQCANNCANRLYGPGCRYVIGRCNSVSDSTGLCYNGCQSGYKQPYCQSKLAYLIHPPVMLHLGYSGFVVITDLKGSNIQGKGIPMFYQLQYKEQTTSYWTKMKPRSFSDGIFQDVTNITGLIPGIWYQTRTVLINDDFNSYQENDIQKSYHYVDCIVPENANFTVTVSNLRTKSIHIQWKVNADIFWCPFEFYELEIKETWRWKLIVRSKSTSASITNLHLNTNYTFRLRVLSGQGATGYTYITAKTREDDPGPVFNLTVSPATSREVMFKWEEPRDTLGGVQSYEILYLCQYQGCNTGCKSSPAFKTNDTSFHLTDLTPHTKYHIQVHANGLKSSTGVVNTFVIGTQQELPEVAPERCMNSFVSHNSSVVTVCWAFPSNCEKINGYPIGYQYQYHVKDEESKSWWHTSDTSATISGLEADTEYIVTVLIVTSAGWNKEYPLVIPVKILI